MHTANHVSEANRQCSRIRSRMPKVAIAPSNARMLSVAARWDSVVPAPILTVYYKPFSEKAFIQTARLIMMTGPCASDYKNPS